MAVSQSYLGKLKVLENETDRTSIPLDGQSLQVIQTIFDSASVQARDIYAGGNSFTPLMQLLDTLARISISVYATETQQDDSEYWPIMFADMRTLHEAKNAGYAGITAEDPWMNFRICEALGIPAFMGCMVRLGDKMIRVVNLHKNSDNNQVGESILDTLADLSAYALITQCLLEEFYHQWADQSYRESKTVWNVRYV